jgi:hypothetical protein
MLCGGATGAPTVALRRALGHHVQALAGNTIRG